MAINYKVLGQSAPAATTATTLYAVPSATQAVVSTVVVANRATTAGSFRLAVRPAGASLQTQHYVAFDTPIGPNSVAAFTMGMTLEATDVLTVYGSTASMSFNAFGSEVTS